MKNNILFGIIFILLTSFQNINSEKETFIKSFYNEIFIKNSNETEIVEKYIEYNDKSGFVEAENTIKFFRKSSDTTTYFKNLKKAVVLNQLKLYSFETFSEADKSIFKKADKNVFKLTVNGNPDVFIVINNKKIKSFFGFKKDDTYMFITY